MSDFLKTKSQFYIPEGIIYLDGNSLGPLTKKAQDRIQHTLNNEWGEMLVTGWNKAGWMDQPNKVGDRIARLIGAAPKTVTVGDTLSIKVFQALASAINFQKNRKVLLTDASNFPSDIYAAQGLINMLKADHELKIVNTDNLVENINENVAAIFFTEVDYRTGRRYDAKKIVKTAKQNGALVILDLAHSAGAIDTNLTELDVDFAVGCTYKYLNGGPGSPAFIYVNPNLINSLEPCLSGWLGHENPFDFSLQYNPASGIDRMRVGTPPVIALAALEASLDIWETVDIKDVRETSIQLTDQFIKGVEQKCPMLQLITPRIPENRGSQVSFSFKHGYAVMQACIERGVIGDFRAPDVMRFGFTPLFVDSQDVERASEILAEIMSKDLWNDPKFQKRNKVT
ncbi:MAG: kynureninase [Paracoccaceae bacterium]|jgi:kynureninase|tara:strand:- start:3407 stop:4600 length:1194 start_codon:yes stop_codon:yes gene_type:complete